MTINAVHGPRDLKVGDAIQGPIRNITATRIEWYDSAMLSAAKNELAQVGVNIHTDEAYAREQGLPAVIADGMIMTNWCSEMLTHHFGLDYLERGELRTKFIKPVFLGTTLSVKGRVRGVEKGKDGAITYDLLVWCEDEKGLKLTDGDAKVTLAKA